MRLVVYLLERLQPAPSFLVAQYVTDSADVCGFTYVSRIIMSRPTFLRSLPSPCGSLFYLKPQETDVARLVGSVIETVFGLAHLRVYARWPFPRMTVVSVAKVCVFCFVCCVYVPLCVCVVC